MSDEMIPAMLSGMLPRLPHLLGILLVAGTAVWGLTRPRKTTGALALAGSGLATLIWLAGSTLSLLPLWNARRGISLTQLGALYAVSGCVTGLLDMVAWALIAAALFVAIRDQKHVDE
jgi:hypothetical protein